MEVHEIVTQPVDVIDVSTTSCDATRRMRAS
jgi:hypothetical protein